MDGFLVVDKPAGITSHDVVQRVRRILRQKKAGHTGTLDPFAVGVLPVALGEGTKAIPYLEESEKEYRGTIRLGIATDTQDCTGTVLSEREWQGVTAGKVLEVMQGMLGEQKQLPPMFSAVKREGVPLYRLARKGETVEREPRKVTVFSFLSEGIELPYVTFAVRCSRGTYVRTLAHDLGERLGCGAHLTKLRRTASGMFSERDAVSLELLEERALRGEGGGLPSPHQPGAGAFSRSDAGRGRGKEGLPRGLSPGGRRSRSRGRRGGDGSSHRCRKTAGPGG